MSATNLDIHYVEKMWGRTDIPNLPSRLEGKRIGELWYSADDASDMPLLVKYIHTSERLSIQVHPGDSYARGSGAKGGKEECWLVLDAEPGATLGIGTVVPLSGEALRAAALSGEIEALMDWKLAQPGDFYFIPAGTVHAIGGGISLVEVQQNVDITYRLYDYGRPRELHLDDGIAVSVAEPYKRQKLSHGPGQAMELLSDGPFSVDAQHLKRGEESRLFRDIAWFIPLRGAGRIAGDDGAQWRAGECWLVRGDCHIVAEEDADFLLATP